MRIASSKTNWCHHCLLYLLLRAKFSFQSHPKFHAKHLHFESSHPTYSEMHAVHKRVKNVTFTSFQKC